MILRRANTADAAELAAVGELTVAADTRDGHVARDVDGYVHELRAAADRARDAELVVATDEGGTLLGTVTYVPAGTPWAEVARPGEAEFRMLAVAPEARGRGVGALLTQWCLDRARAEGCTAVVLSTLPTMHTAHRIYERLGFRRTPERDWYPAEGILLVTYLLPL